MRKKLTTAILLTVSAMILAAIPAGAAVDPGESKDIRVTMGGLTVLVDGGKAIFRDVNGQEVEPILYQGTTYVPIRGVSDYLGQAVDYVAETRTVLIGRTQEQREAQLLRDEIRMWTRIAPVWFRPIPDMYTLDQCALAAGGDYYFIASPGPWQDRDDVFPEGNEIWIYHPATQKAELLMAGVKVHTIDSVDAQGNVTFSTYKAFGAEQLIGHTTRKFWRAENRVTTVEYVPDRPQEYTEADIARALAETFETAYLQSAARASAIRWSDGQYVGGVQKDTFLYVASPVRPQSGTGKFFCEIGRFDLTNSVYTALLTREVPAFDGKFGVTLEFLQGDEWLTVRDSSGEYRFDVEKHVIQAVDPAAGDIPWKLSTP
ncbi:MAG: copper amine oxidase N-terminal domain-containing protein [Oscillospiraceae bacterium]|jgi:hypothetical protein|nr:copper amine oxidase N-terminal domain-containing protein [Oscillospiraceae bacterium]